MAMSTRRTIIFIRVHFSFTKFNVNVFIIIITNDWYDRVADRALSFVSNLIIPLLRTLCRANHNCYIRLLLHIGLRLLKLLQLLFSTLFIIVYFSVFDISLVGRLLIALSIRAVDDKEYW